VVIDNYKLETIEMYMGKPKMREDRAREALILVNEDDKDDKASKYVYGLVPSFGKGMSVLCLVYNATGDTLYHVSNHNWYDRIRGPSHPTEIGNGQWAAFLHGGTAAVVYRGKNKKGEDEDYLISWFASSAFLVRNRVCVSWSSLIIPS
jgi:hypothetical protein